MLESKHALSVAEIFVIKSKNSVCLLSLTTAQELGLVTLNLDTLSVSKDNKNIDSGIKEILDNYSNVFNGLGMLKDYKVQLNIQ